jgi:hypothetical protein
MHAIALALLVVRPCKDGEVDSVCRDGVCRIEAWRC